MMPDDEAWLSQLELRKDAMKAALTSNARVDKIDPTFLAEQASALEQIFKDCRSKILGYQQ